MEIEKLRSFAEVYTCKNMTQAADKLFISQSTLSRRIQMLEEELNTELFTRSGAGMLPTKSADILYYDAIKLIREHDQLELKMLRFRKGMHGSTSIAVNPALKLTPIMRATTIMQSRYPEMDVFFDCDAGTEVLKRFLNEEVDIGITVLGELSGIENVSYEILCKNTFAMLVGRNHRLWKKRPVYLGELDGERLYCADDTESHVFKTILTFVRSRGVQFSEVTRCRSTAEQMLYISKGDGIGFTGLVSNELYFAMPDLVETVPFDDVQIDNGYVIALYKEENQRSNEYVDILKTVW